MPEETTLDDLDAIKGSPWTPSGVLRDVLPRPVLSWDEPHSCLLKNASATEHENLERHSPEVRIHARLCKMKETVAQRIFPSRLGRGRTEAASRTDPVYRDRAERAEQRKMDFSLEPSIVPEPPTEEKEGEDQPSARDTKRARGEPEQDFSSEIPIPSADETLTPPVPVRLHQVRLQFWSLIKQWCEAHIQ